MDLPPGERAWLRMNPIRRCLQQRRVRTTSDAIGQVFPAFLAEYAATDPTGS